jgi:hypothetical protein
VTYFPKKHGPAATLRRLTERTRLFTRKTAQRLIEESGYRVVKRKTTVIPVELILGLKPENAVARFAASLLAVATAILPGLLGYQSIFVASAAELPPEA